MGNDHIDLKYHTLLDNLGICVSAAGLQKYSWNARLYMLLPRWMQPLFPRLRDIYLNEKRNRETRFMDRIIQAVDKQCEKYE